MMSFRLIVLLAAALSAFSFGATNGNRLAYLDSDDPFYVGRDFPKLITPQWVGEDGVDAVVILSIDDMRDTPKYESMLRPVLERLKKIDGRAPVSIMVNTIAPTNAQLQAWLREGVSLECHTIAHPCPLCQKGDFNAAAATYHDCVDLMNQVPGTKPVAFRMPCCDSMNSPTPRFYSEIFNRTSANGNFLSIDSSVMVILTTNDPALPRELVLEDVPDEGRDGALRRQRRDSGATDGANPHAVSPNPDRPLNAGGDAAARRPYQRDRFRKYLPSETNATTRVSMGSFTTTIEDYPYPYVIGKLCWEFPCIVPSDWEANNLHKPNNPKTVEDWKRALDAVVIKQGVMTIVFHPHGWIQATQMVEFVDYAATKYGKRVKFLNFKEAQERLEKNLLASQPLRAINGQDNGVRLADINNDGYMDVLIGNAQLRRSRTWKPSALAWSEQEFPTSFRWRNADGISTETGTHLGVIHSNGYAAIFSGDEETDAVVDGAILDGEPVRSVVRGRNRGVRFRDVDNDGVCELILGNEKQNAVFAWSKAEKLWKKLPFALPEGTRIVDEQGRDAGLRFVDVDGDGYDDVIFSNHERYSLHLFRKDARNLRLKPGWTDEIISGPRVNPLTDPIPPIVRDGTNRNNGVWFKNGTMWIQNEDTAHLPDKVDRRTFKQLLTGFQPRALSPEESLNAMRVRPGFKVELVASEPLIQSPVAFEWSADGKLWVVEMGDYPSGVDGKGKGGGRVRVLEDTNGDGRYDEAATFLEGLNFPTGIYPWRRGVVISAAPEIFYAEDTNGDGKADVREVLFTGFTEGNQQHRVNGFVYGLDGWLYGANGDSGGNVRAVGGTSSPNPSSNRDSQRSSLQGINIRGQDFRINPDKRLVEAIAGQTQFGRHRDDFGNWFGNNNPNWLWHYFFPEHYLARNPLLPLKTTKTMLARYSESTRCFPISRTLSRFNDAHTANHTTSANSPTPYRDELFGKDFETSVFISEPVHNLVHRQVLEPDGVTFTSRRAKDETNSEFLASSDNWFRPTMLKTGPDGALYIADMYRFVIEHPEWIPVEMQKRLDLRAGEDRGRIYRVHPEGITLRKIPKLDHLATYELGEALNSPNGWQRDTAQRLLQERGAMMPHGLFARLLKSGNPKVRVQALAVMGASQQLDAEILARALTDRDSRVRAQAVVTSERLTRGATIFRTHVVLQDQSLELIAAMHATKPEVIQAANNLQTAQIRTGQLLKVPTTTEATFTMLLRLTDDPQIPVRYQLAFTLGEWDDPRAAEALARLAGDEDENVRNAALSSAPRHARAMLAVWEKLPANQRAPAITAMLKKLVANPPALAVKNVIIERTNKLSTVQRAEREKVLARYVGVPKLKGDARNGPELFKQNCAQCHRLRGEGTEVGPDLGMMAGKPVEQLVMGILDPNAAMEARYQSFTALMKDGHEVSGIIIAETPTTLTLRAPNKPDETLLRGELKELTAGGTSLMPEGLEHAFTPQQLADLIAYVIGGQ